MDPVDPSIQVVPLMENQIDKMGNGMETGTIVVHRDPSIQIILTLGPKLRKCYLHWAVWIHGDNLNANAAGQVS